MKFTTPAESVPLDAVDRQILVALQNNARQSNRALAAQVHLSPSSCLARVRRLVESGVIARFRAEVDPATVGRPLEAMIAIREPVRPAAEIDHFLEGLMQRPETLALFHVTGPIDYLLHVAVEDVVGLRRLVLDLNRPDVIHLETSVIYQHWPGGAILPLR